VQQFLGISSNANKPIEKESSYIGNQLDSASMLKKIMLNKSKFL